MVMQYNPADMGPPGAFRAGDVAGLAVHLDTLERRVWTTLCPRYSWQGKPELTLPGREREVNDDPSFGGVGLRECHHGATLSPGKRPSSVPLPSSTLT